MVLGSNRSNTIFAAAAVNHVALYTLCASTYICISLLKNLIPTQINQLNKIRLKCHAIHRFIFVGMLISRQRKKKSWNLTQQHVRIFHYTEFCYQKQVTIKKKNICEELYSNSKIGRKKGKTTGINIYILVVECIRCAYEYLIFSNKTQDMMCQ